MAVWTSEKILELIERYEEHSCLYNTTLKAYHNRDKKQKAVAEIAATLEVPEAEVKQKFKNIRTQYTREKQKERKRPTGTGTDDVYKSKWPYFDKLKFLDDFIIGKTTSSNLQVSGDEETNENDEESNDDANKETNEGDTMDQKNSVKRPLEKASQKLTKKQKKEAKEDLLLEKAIMCMENTGKGSNSYPVKDSDDIFAQFIASELRSIKDAHLKRLIKWQIQSVLFNGVGASSASSSPSPNNSWMPGQSPQMQGFRYSSPTPSIYSPFSPASSTHDYNNFVNED